MICGWSGSPRMPRGRDHGGRRRSWPLRRQPFRGGRRERPDSGSGTYLAAYWGEKPTGGYSMSVRSARLEGSRVIVRLALKEPPRDAILTQVPHLSLRRGGDPGA